MIKIISYKKYEKSPSEYYLIDVRSEKEFKEDHTINAVNMPVLDDEQRHILGYVFKQVDKEKAIALGYDILNQKIDDYVKKLEKIKKPIVIMCARGGKRSRAVTEFLIKRGIKAFQLKNGYKDYRKTVREDLANFDYSKKKLFVLSGLTGTNKTNIISQIDLTINLEDLAQHRSSLFGAVGLKPRTQKFFDTLLLDNLKKSKTKILFEGESLRIGDISMPKKLFSEIKKATQIKIEMSIDQRIKNILADYFDTKEKIAEIKSIIPKLKERFGKAKIDELLTQMDNKKYYDVVKFLLEKYYDPLYKHTIDNKEYAVIIKTDDTEDAVKQIRQFIRIA